LTSISEKDMVREYEIQAFERLQGKKIMECFCDDLTASTTVKILSINRNTINAYFTDFCVKILENSIKEHNKEFGIFELDESYFGVQGVRGVCIRGHCPFSGHVGDHTGGVRASLLLTSRMLATLPHEGLAKGTSGKSALCKPYWAPTMLGTNYPKDTI